ncbi:methyltransferase type 11 [Nostoc sp. T09]|uniref:class I SAM-dependent methyltransferase n=1 Tax=Nostoc sp. T09 TaxID=1932621 RepID=UPI000A3BB4AB|nr:class I SAM-dependent methyltransferase [Nostoc sp. T09]OUL18750.1 methyltransferase type 11 [Nostoc sp. T09]
MKLINVVPRVLQNLDNHQFGKCNICGNLTAFLCIDVQAVRNNMYCPFCRSSSRKRHVAKIIIHEVVKTVSVIGEIPKTQALKIYNADVDDAFYQVLHQQEIYTCSTFSPELKPGSEIRPGVFCQDLKNLTFADETFDIVITEDVFEHVRNHEQGLREIHRVLKFGGYHIFTVPCNFDRQTIVRVDTSGEEDIHLLPPEYHGDKIRGKILAYRTFGIDIFDLLKNIGFETKVDFSNYLDRKNGIFDSYVFCSKKV